MQDHHASRSFIVEIPDDADAAIVVMECTKPVNVFGTTSHVAVCGKDAQEVSLRPARISGTQFAAAGPASQVKRSDEIPGDAPKSASVG